MLSFINATHRCSWQRRVEIFYAKVDEFHDILYISIFTISVCLQVPTHTEREAKIEREKREI